jgi:hypothetical protein
MTETGRPMTMRVAAVWGTTVVALKTLARGESFVLGDGGSFAMPDDFEGPPMPVRAVQGGWEIDPRGVRGGIVRLRGRDEDPRALASAGVPVAVIAGDYGLLQYGLFSVFFQPVTEATELKGGFGLELLVSLAFFSSAVLHVGLIGFLWKTETPEALPKPLELSSAEEYAARFRLRRAEIEEPQPAPAGDEASASSGVKDPGAQDKKPQGGGQKMRGDEGKLGLRGTESKTEIPGEVRPSTNLGGLSEVLSSETGQEIKQTLKSIETVANALGGLNSQTLTLGSGPGSSLRGVGGGGGGRDQGVAFGAGTLQTGWGAGNGGGYGGGTGGPGGRGAGGNGRGGPGGSGGGGNGTGSGVGEARVAVDPGSPTARGGLSPEQIRRVVMAHTGALRACYESEAQRNPGLRGGVTVQWQIEPNGSVSTASIASTTLSNARVEGCVARQVKGWRFPQSDTPTTVAAYPFKFGVGG